MRLILGMALSLVLCAPVSATILESFASGLTGNLVTKGFNDTMNYAFADQQSNSQTVIQPSLNQDYLNQYYQQQYFYNQGLLEVPPVFNPPQNVYNPQPVIQQPARKLSSYYNPCDYIRPVASTGFSYGVTSARVRAPQAVPVTTGIFAQSAGGGAFNQIVGTGCSQARNHFIK